jgi:hypothetical protein
MGYSLCLFWYRTIRKIDLRENNIYRETLYKIRRYTAAMQYYARGVWLLMPSIGAVAAFLIGYGDLNIGLFLSFTISMVLFIALYFTIFKKNVKILIEVGKGRSVSGKIALKSAERSAPFIIICILSIAMSTGQMRALQLKNQNALEITINSAKIERVVFGTTASGHILYDKDSEKFSFLSHDGKILFTTKDR